MATKQTVPPPPVGQTPLSGDPNSFKWGQGQFQGAGGGQQAGQYYAWKDFANEFGRNPTQQELDQLTPAYMGADPNIANTAGGKANVAAYYQQQTNTPQNIYSQEQGKYLQDAPKYADQVTAQFQNALGRAPTQDELSHFGALIASGQDQYQVGQALQQTQEYQNTANTKFQNQLQGQLQGSNATYFNQYIAPELQSQAALAGRSLDSSGVNAQLANAALQQNQGLQNFLAQTTAGNYASSTANASNQYNQLMSQQYGLQNANVSSGLANQAANTQYNQNLNMFQLQQSAYNNYLNQYGKRSNGLGGLIGGIGGALIGGAATGWSNPQGYQAGFNIGSGLGNAGQSASRGGGF
jgi:hypothetical protein